MNNTNINLPELTGTPKQIEWAEGIRVAVINTLTANLAEAERSYKEIPSENIKTEVDVYSEMLEKITANFQKIAKATDFIDRRHTLTGENVVETAKKEIQSRNTARFCEDYKARNGQS